MKKIFVWAALSGIALSSIITGCATATTTEEIGTLQMAVTGQGSSGKTFGLSGTFLLDDPESLSITTDALDSQSNLSLSPQVGDYNLTLCNAQATPVADCQLPTAAWELFELTCDPAGPVERCLEEGNALTATPVLNAQLVSPNPQPVSILLNQRSTAVIEILVPGEGTVTFARGDLSIRTVVTEGFTVGSVCTEAFECQSKVCVPSPMEEENICVAASCDDGVQNGGEAGADCGGPCSTTCPEAEVPEDSPCIENMECNSSQICLLGPDDIGECRDAASVACTDGSDCGRDRVCGDPDDVGVPELTCRAKRCGDNADCESNRCLPEGFCD